METFGWIAALLLAFAAHSANAQEEGSEDGAAESPYVRDGAYLGLGGIAAIENFDPSFPPSRPIDRWSGGLSARGRPPDASPHGRRAHLRLGEPVGHGGR